MGGLFLLMVVAPALSQESGDRRRLATTQPAAEAEKPAAPGVAERAPLVKRPMGIRPGAERHQKVAR